MLLGLLIVTRVAAEWVEISQQHYRKPLRTHNYNPFTIPEIIEVEETTTIWNYNNKSVSEYNWNKSPIGQLNVGNVKRVQYPAVKSTEAVQGDENNPNIDTDEFELKPNREADKTTVELSDKTKQKGTVERVSNTGTVKRVHLNNSPVKSPVVNIDDTGNIPKTRYEEFLINNEEKTVGLLNDKMNTETKINNRRIYINKIDNKLTTETTSTFSTEDETAFTEEVHILKKYPKQEFKSHMNNLLTPKPTFVTVTEDIVQYKKPEERFHTPTQNSRLGVTKKKQIFTEPTVIIEKVTKGSVDIQKLAKQNIINYEPKNSDDKINVITKLTNKLSRTESNKDREDEQQKQKKENNNPKLNEMHSTNNVKQDREKVDKTTKENKEHKNNNMENLLKLIKVVAGTISQNTRRSNGGKMKYLHELKDSILRNIADRIDATWPDDDAISSRRRSRAAHPSPRGHHVAFPSSESALMTISFLTFAVFLIKLVLQLIQTYKNKTMMIAPVMVAAAGRGTSSHLGNR